MVEAFPNKLGVPAFDPAPKRGVLVPEPAAGVLPNREVAGGPAVAVLFALKSGLLLELGVELPLFAPNVNVIVGGGAQGSNPASQSKLQMEL